VRVRAQLGRLAVLAVALLAASCASTHTNLTAARNDCTEVGRLSGAPPGTEQRGSRKSLVPASQISPRWTWPCTTWRGHWTVTTPACPTMPLTR
jgi:hypothetical protein